MSTLGAIIAFLMLYLLFIIPATMLITEMTKSKLLRTIGMIFWPIACLGILIVMFVLTLARIIKE